MSSTAPHSGSSSPHFRRGRLMLTVFAVTLMAMVGAAVAALRTAPTAGGVACGTTYSLTTNVGTVNWTAAPWTPTTSTGPTDPYPGATQTNDCANIFFSTVDLTGTIQVAGLNITASSGLPELHIGSGGSLNVIGNGNLTGISPTQVGAVRIDSGGVMTREAQTRIVTTGDG